MCLLNIPKWFRVKHIILISLLTVLNLYNTFNLQIWLKASLSQGQMSALFDDLYSLRRF